MVKKRSKNSRQMPKVGDHNAKELWSRVAVSLDHIYHERDKEFEVDADGVFAERMLRQSITPKTETPKDSGFSCAIGRKSHAHHHRSLPAKLMQRLRRQQQHPDRILDLHCLSVAEAENLLPIIMHKAYQQQQRILLVITGKGMVIGEQGTPELRGQLRRMVPYWLAETSLSRYVQAYDWAPDTLGGQGALVIQLRKKM